MTLPKEDSEWAKEILKDEYKLDFVSLRENYEEKDLHNALEQNLIKFLLELGNGFAFVGSHVPFVVTSHWAMSMILIPSCWDSGCFVRARRILG